uniref:TPR-repeat containing protein A n=1 Tax=Philodina roseola TaxID=96448 RepID=B2L3I5_PHIRO|nr:TPR-repeat containing protein A [Philodina roseola]
MANITDNDKYVLNAMFNPTYPLDFDKETATDTTDAENQSKIFIYHSSGSLIFFKKLEEEGVKLAEQNQISEAIERFDQAITLDPNQPSAYNNRAQAYQLQNRIDDAMNDLNKAIQLASAGTHYQKTLSMALTQRGVLHRVLQNEKESLDDFTQAAELGSNFAKQQVLLSNPFAAACNQMLSKMLKQTACRT